jgi:hypothetical protein
MIRPEYWALLTDAPYPKDGNPLFRILGWWRARNLWIAHRDEVLAEWIARRAGTRPSLWWRYDMWPALRPQVGGKESAHGGAKDFGFPGDWQWLGFSFANPPVFESQAAFLSRLDFARRRSGTPGRLGHVARSATKGTVA